MIIVSLFKLLKDYYLRFSKTGVDYARYRGVEVGNDCRIFTTTLGTEPWLISIGNKSPLLPESDFLPMMDLHGCLTMKKVDENYLKESR